MLMFRQRLIASIREGACLPFVITKAGPVEAKLQLAFDSTSQTLLPCLGWYDGKYFM